MAQKTQSMLKKNRRGKKKICLVGKLKNERYEKTYVVKGQWLGIDTRRKATKTMHKKQTPNFQHT